MFIGNPFTDVPSLQTYSFVVTDNDFALAEREAIRIANSFWSNHEQMRVPLVSLEEMARIVKENAGGTLAIVDASDATSSGASGDSNAVLRTLQGAGYTDRTLLPIVDAHAVREAMDAPGSSSANLPDLGHQRCPRPIFPLDTNVLFTPQAKRFQRGDPQTRRMRMQAHGVF